MNKRDNEHSQAEQEPAAKRSITSEQQQALKLQAAQDAFDRLDQKTANETCAEVSMVIGNLILSLSFQTLRSHFLRFALLSFLLLSTPDDRL